MQEPTLEQSLEILQQRLAALQKDLISLKTNLEQLQAQLQPQGQPPEQVQVVQQPVQKWDEIEKAKLLTILFEIKFNKKPLFDSAIITKEVTKSNFRGESIQAIAKKECLSNHSWTDNNGLLTQKIYRGYTPLRGGFITSANVVGDLLNSIANIETLTFDEKEILINFIGTLVKQKFELVQEGDKTVVHIKKSSPKVFIKPHKKKN